MSKLMKTLLKLIVVRFSEEKQASLCSPSIKGLNIRNCNNYKARVKVKEAIRDCLCL